MAERATCELEAAALGCLRRDELAGAARVCHGAVANELAVRAPAQHVKDQQPPIRQRSICILLCRCGVRELHVPQAKDVP